MLSKESLGILDEQQDPQPANVTDSEQNELDQHSDHEGLEAFEPLNVGSDALNNDIFGGLSDNLVYAAGDWRHERVQDWNLSNQSFEFQDQGGSTAQRWGFRSGDYESSEERPSPFWG